MTLTELTPTGWDGYRNGELVAHFQARYQAEDALRARHVEAISPRRQPAPAPILAAVPTYTLQQFLLHDDPTVSALLITGYHRGELGRDATHTIASGLLRGLDWEQVYAGIDDIADLLDKAEDYDGDPADAIDKHYGQSFSGPADAFADIERDKARADARLAAELLASLGGVR